MALVPESVSRSIRISEECSSNRLNPACLRRRSRSDGVVRRKGSTLLILNGSMIVFIGYHRGTALAQLLCGNRRSNRPFLLAAHRAARRAVPSVQMLGHV